MICPAFTGTVDSSLIFIAPLNPGRCIFFCSKENWHTPTAKACGVLTFAPLFAFIPHCHDSFAGTYYRVLASFQSWKLRFCGYQWSTCMHPCLHAMGICLLSVPLIRLQNGDIPNPCWSPSRSITAWGFSCMTFSCFHGRSFMPRQRNLTASIELLTIL